MASGIEARGGDDVTAYKDKYARYRAKNREKRRQASAEWWAKHGAEYREKNRPRLRKIAAKHRDENRDTVRARVRAFQLEHPDRQRDSERKYREKHPNRRKKSSADYRAKPDTLIKERLTRKAWTLRNLDRLAANSALRRATKLRATPSWADLSAIKALYSNARRITAETGIPHHVDHIYPLKCDWCCGLHVENNLQILEGKKNLSKGNRPPLL
ncbi:hypothetical protein AB4037_23360 [Labrys sp. KB_33_2]|uniref:hypothetical protein n=1 Tax=Labrys sp. KB_33_2 TaxID=3237479 RepID=UPI003F927D92